MLALSRRPTERIIIEHAGETLVVFIDDIRRDKVRILLDGPQSFVIAREEIVDASRVPPLPERKPKPLSFTPPSRKKPRRNRFGMGGGA